MRRCWVCATTRAFLRDLLDHPAFREARMHTTLIDQWRQAGEPLLQRPSPMR